MDALLPIIVLIFVATITPGPNNLMLAASGLNYGLRATLPHILGIHLGLYTMVALAAAGLGPLVLAQPILMMALKGFASIYLIYLAWKLVEPRLNLEEGKTGRPLSVLQGWSFQFVNPKAWLMTTSALALALPIVGKPASAALTLCLIWASVGSMCNLLWVLAGSRFRPYLDRPGYGQALNGILILLIVFSVAGFWMMD